MKAEVLLNRSGSLPAMRGYQQITREVDFLQYATEDIPLLICGEKLCSWAESFYRLHGRPFRYQESASEALRRAFPVLSEKQAIELAGKAKLSSLTVEEISTEFILKHCYPNDFLVWQTIPSREHAAHWLIWLYKNEPTEAENIILKEFAALMESKASDRPEKLIYHACNKEQSVNLILLWMGLIDEAEGDLGEFPVSLPADLLDEIKTQWTNKIITTQGSYFEKMFTFPLPLALRQELAECAALFYEKNKNHLTREILWKLQPYLSLDMLSKLEKVIPPPEPTQMPDDEELVLGWFESSYLPYRRWQAQYGDKSTAERALKHAQSFTEWYLNHYPQWLLQSGWISFQHSVRLRESESDAVIFCVILDGLPAWDAEEFTRQVSAKIERLVLQKKSYCFAPLPTVTQFAKESLLRGVPPYFVSQTTLLGKILPDDGSPLQKLMNTQPKDIIFWRVSQPDAAYHFESESKRERQVRAELESILYAIKDVVEKLPPHLLLQIIITSDHGRLFNAKSPRSLTVPSGMQAHGRVAWGKSQKEFNESGFEIDEKELQIAVHGERFGMTEDMVIAFGEESFKGARSGHESYPHGGLFPEEAIVPWFVFQRDAQKINLQITMLGKAESGKPGVAIINVINASQIKLECLSVSLSTKTQADGTWQILPLCETKLQIAFNTWPSKSDLENLKARLLFQQPNGATFTVEVKPLLEVTSLYERDSSLLKDLEL